MEVYVEDLLVKSKSSTQYIEDLMEIFTTLKRYKMHFNLLKCVLAAVSRKFLGIFITPKGIKMNSDKE